MTKIYPFEEWMKRQEVDIEETVELGSWQTRIEDLVGRPLSPAQKTVTAKVYSEKYEDLMAYNIRPVTYTYATGPRAGQKETRWAISGYPGLWGAEGMREIYEKIRGE